MPSAGEWRRGALLGCFGGNEVGFLLVCTVVVCLLKVMFYELLMPLALEGWAF